MLINTTSVGMYPNTSQMPISKLTVKNSKIIVDVISNPAESELIKFANKCNKITINGLTLAFHQSLSQFKLYTGRNPPKTKFPVECEFRIESVPGPNVRDVLF